MGTARGDGYLCQKKFTTHVSEQDLKLQILKKNLVPDNIQHGIDLD